MITSVAEVNVTDERRNSIRPWIRVGTRTCTDKRIVHKAKASTNVSIIWERDPGASWIFHQHIHPLN